MDPRRIVPPTPPFGQPAVSHPVAKPGTPAAIAKPAVITAAPPIKLDAAGRIDEDVSCRKCGYNLRGLLPDGRCPECGAAVGRSLHGDLLRFSDPDWVQKLASGMNWIVASIFMGMIGGFFSAIFVAIFTSILSSRSFFVLAPLSTLAFGTIALVGYWRVTTPDPARSSEESNFSPRKLVRVAQLTNYAVAPVSSLMQQLAWTVPSMVTSAASGLVGLVGTVAIFIYARKLALRIPRRNTRPPLQDRYVGPGHHAGDLSPGRRLDRERPPTGDDDNGYDDGPRIANFETSQSALQRYVLHLGRNETRKDVNDTIQSPNASVDDSYRDELRPGRGIPRLRNLVAPSALQVSQVPE